MDQATTKRVILLSQLNNNKAMNIGNNLYINNNEIKYRFNHQV